MAGKPSHPKISTSETSHKAIYPRCLVLTKNCHNSSSWHYSDSGVCGSVAAAALSMKTPMETAMAGEKTTNNNQLKAAGAMATETATMKAMAMTMKMKATAAAAAAASDGRGKDNNQQPT